jgi:hypothetical protein
MPHYAHGGGGAAIRGVMSTRCAGRHKNAASLRECSFSTVGFFFGAGIPRIVSPPPVRQADACPAWRGSLLRVRFDHPTHNSR